MKRWLLCGAFCLLAAVFTSLGMLQLEGAAASLPEGFFYANPDGTISQPVAEEELDHPLITGSVREGEQIKFLQFSSQVTTIEEAEEIVLSLLGPGAGELVLSTGDLAVMFRQLKAVFWLALIPCLLAIAYGLTVRVIPPWWQRSSLKTKVAAAVPLGALFLALFAAYILAWQSLQIPDTFLPTEHFFDLPFYISQIRWALEGVGLGQPAWGDIPAGERMALGLGLLAAALLAAVIAGVLLIQALRKRVYKTVGKD